MKIWLMTTAGRARTVYRRVVPRRWRSLVLLLVGILTGLLLTAVL